MNNIINNGINMGKTLDSFFINKNLIEKYKSFYEYNQLENLLNTTQIKAIINKYSDESNYIYETKISKMIKEIIPMLSDEYKKIIQNKDNKDFINEINNPNLYSKNIHRYDNPKVVNIIDCIIIREEIGELLMKDKNKKIIDILNGSKIHLSIT